MTTENKDQEKITNDLEKRIVNIEVCLDTLFNKLLAKYPNDPDVKNAWEALEL